MESAKISYEEFVSQIRCRLYQLIPEEVNMEVNPVIKNNSVHLDSLVLFRNDSNCSPSFYLQDYYEYYIQGSSIDQLTAQIYQKWQEFMENSPACIPDLSLENCRDFIIYRLINAEKNREILKTVPYIPFFDLAIVFYYLVHRDNDGIQSLRITNQIMEEWGLSTHELYQYAQVNTPCLFPKCFRSMNDFVNELELTSENVSEEDPASFSPYILTNSNGVNGAAAWLYPEALDDVAGCLNTNFYILPSSIHELLILPEHYKFSSSELLDMVQTVNRQCVDREEFLSDNIYLYHIEKKAIKMITAAE